MRHISVNTTDGQVAMALVARECARRRMGGARVTGYVAAATNLPNDMVAIFMAGRPDSALSTFFVTVEGV